MERVLIVEDDRFLREALLETFRQHGFAASAVLRFPAEEAEILAARPDLLLLDLNLPGRSGFTLCRSLKERSAFPILILTGQDGLAEELRALSLGADDYLTKPCHPARLIARAERLLRAYRESRPLLRAAGLTLDPETWNVRAGGGHVVLAETEGRLLRALMERFPETVPAQTLREAVWGPTAYVDEGILQVNLTRLRRSLASVGRRETLKTERGRGYRLEETV